MDRRLRLGSAERGPEPSLNRLVELAVAIATTNSKRLLCRQMRAKLVRVALLDSSRWLVSRVAKRTTARSRASNRSYPRAPPG